jgi:pyruvate dehydrogenase E1 component alpha subunit
MDVLACHAAMRGAVDHIRTQGGPFFLEFRTYRFRPHSMFDPELYRDKAEVAKWKEHDPIATFTQRCLADGLLTAGDVTAIEDAAATEVADAVAYAEAGTLESIDTLTRDVMTPVGGRS